MSKCESCKKYDDCVTGSGLTWPCGAYAPKVVSDVRRIQTCPDCGNLMAYNSYFDAFYCPRCGGVFKKIHQKTNADRIRAMSDEDLARLCFRGAPYCKAEKPLECNITGFVDGLTPCEQCCLEWLQKPAEEADSG